MNRPEGRCASPALLSSGDGLFDDGVAAVVCFDLGQRQLAVGDESVVVPVGEQGELAAGDGADPADLAGVAGVGGEDGEGGLGDVGAGDLRTRQPVRDRLPRSLWYLLDRGPDPLRS